ncbi:MAG: YncE family protein [Chthoniobacterales bacterium]
MKKVRNPAVLVLAFAAIGASALLVSPGAGQEPAERLTPQNGLPKNKVVATLSVGVFPLSLAITPKGDEVYVPNSHSYTVSVIQTSTNSVIATIPVGNTPTHVAISPDGRLAYVSNTGSHSVSVISTINKTVLYKFNVISYFPEGLALSPDGKQLYVASSGYPFYGGFISIIDTNTLVLLNVFKPGGDPEELRFSPDGKYVYALSTRGMGHGYICKIDTASQTIVQTGIGSADFTGQPTGLAISPDGTTLYGSNPFIFVLAFNAADGSLEKKIHIFPGETTERQVYEPVVTPNGKFLYVPDPYRGTVTMVNTATNKVVGSPITVGAFPMYLAVTPDNNYLYVSNDADGTISVVDISQ